MTAPGPLYMYWRTNPVPSCQRQWAYFSSVWAVLVARGCDSCWAICPAVLLQWTGFGTHGFRAGAIYLGLRLADANNSQHCYGSYNVLGIVPRAWSRSCEPGRSIASLSPFCRWGMTPSSRNLPKVTQADLASVLVPTFTMNLLKGLPQRIGRIPLLISKTLLCGLFLGSSLLGRGGSWLSRLIKKSHSTVKRKDQLPCTVQATEMPSQTLSYAWASD